VEIDGIERLKAALAAKSVEVDAAAERAVTEAGHDLEASVKRSFRTAHTAGSPTPSAPDTPPAVVSGTLRRSVRVTDPVRDGFGTYTLKVGPTVVYARIQELGGVITPKTGQYLRFRVNGREIYKKSVTLPARPYFKPAHAQFEARDVLRRRLAQNLAVAFQT
jgi:phage gpG-like protein